MPSFRAGWKKIFERCPIGLKQGRDVYVRMEVYPAFQKLSELKQSSYQLMTLYRAVVGLNSDPQSGGSANAVGTLRNLFLNGVSIEYYLDNGDVLISKLRFSSSISSASGMYDDGLFRVFRRSDAWDVSRNKEDFMELSHRWDGAHYAAVPGKFSTNQHAGRRMLGHIKRAYSKDVLEKNIEVNDNHFSMYYSSAKKHGTLEAANSVASLLQQAADAKASVNWLVHGEGAKTFEKSLRFLQDSPSLSRFSAGDDEAVRYLRAKFSGQKVYLSNPIGAGKKDIELLCAKVGVTYVDTKENLRDLRSSASRRNVCKEIAEVSAKAVLAGGVGVVGLKEIGVTSAQKAAEVASGYIATAVASPGATTIAVAAAAGYGVFVAAKGSFNKTNGAYKAVKALMVSTFGSASEYWYESDDDLLEQMSA